MPSSFHLFILSSTIALIAFFILMSQKNVNRVRWTENEIEKRVTKLRNDFPSRNPLYSLIVIVGSFFIRRKKTKIIGRIKLSKKQLNEIASKYSMWNISTGMIWFIIITPLFIYFVRSAIIKISDIQLSHFPNNVYILRDFDKAFAASLAFIIILGLSILNFLHRIKYGKKEYTKEYEQYLRQRYEINIPTKWYAVIVPLYLSLMILSLDCYVRITDKEFIINRYLGFKEKIYSFNDIQKIDTFDGDVYKVNIIKFKDGYKYQFYYKKNNSYFAGNESIVSYVKEKIE